MNESNIGLAIFLLIAVVFPPSKYFGARGFMLDWDHLIEKPAKRLYPPKFIQFRYDIGKTRINIITYLVFLVDFADWVLCISLLPCVLLFKGDILDVTMVVYAFVFFIINVPIGIAHTICVCRIAKKKKIKLNTAQYIAMRTIAALLILQHSPVQKEAMQWCKEYEEIIEPFLKDFERCLKKKKGVRYISEEGLKWVIDKIIPKYQEHLTYNISGKEPKSTEPPKKLLTIYLIKNNKTIIQVPIKKA